MASVKKELVPGSFALAIAAAFLFANRCHYYAARYSEYHYQTWPTVRVHKFTGHVDEWKGPETGERSRWFAWKTHSGKTYLPSIIP